MELDAQAFINTIKELSELLAETMLQKNLCEVELKKAQERISELEEKLEENTEDE